MASVFKRKDRKCYCAAWLNADGTRVVRSTGTVDKRLAARIAREWEEKDLARRSGLVDPAAERLTAHASSPISVHADAYRAFLAGKGGKERHIVQTDRYIREAVEGNCWATIRDITAEGFQRWLAERKRRDGFGARTFNARLIALRGFTSWLHRHGRLAVDPLITLQRRKESADRRLVRRVLSQEEFSTLIRTTLDGPIRSGMDGESRAMLYRVLAATGVRRSEATSLTRGSFVLDGQSGPLVVVSGAYTKNGTEAVLPLPRSLVEVLSEWLRDQGENTLWPLPQKSRARVLVPDLEDAGIEPGQSAKGQPVVDFHSFRHGYITALARSGASVKATQTLARHSDPKLTLNVYTHLELSDGRAAVENAFGSSNPPKSDQLRATGTTDFDAGERTRKRQRDTHTDSHTSASGCAQSNNEPSDDDAHKSLVFGDFRAPTHEDAGPDRSAPRRTRTFDPLIKSQLLYQLS